MKRWFLLLVAVVMAIGVPTVGSGETKLLYEGKELEPGVYSFTCKEVDVAFVVLATFNSMEDYAQYLTSPTVAEGLSQYAVRYYYVEKGDETLIGIGKNQILLIDRGSGNLVLKEKEEQPSEEVLELEAAEEKMLAILRDPKRSSGEKLLARLDYYTVAYGSREDGLEKLIGVLSVSCNEDIVTEMFVAAQAGEEVHKFRRVDYDAYNMPAEKNGFKGDKILVEGSIQKYVSDGNKKNRTYGMIVEQPDGNRWLVYCAEKQNGKLCAKRMGSDPEAHVFEGYEGQEVAVYGKYMGFSEKYKLPVVDIFTYGGMLVVSENTFIRTDQAYQRVLFGSDSLLPELIGAEHVIESDWWDWR